MKRHEFLALADNLHDFILDSIEEFAVGAGYPFDREAFERQSSSDIPQLAVEALAFGTEAYQISYAETAEAA